MKIQGHYKPVEKKLKDIDDAVVFFFEETGGAPWIRATATDGSQYIVALDTGYIRQITWPEGSVIADDDKSFEYSANRWDIYTPTALLIIE